jgi:hypothetical protein
LVPKSASYRFVGRTQTHVQIAFETVAAFAGIEFQELHNRILKRLIALGKKFGSSIKTKQQK